MNTGTGQSILLGRFDTHLPNLDMGSEGMKRWRVGSERVSRRASGIEPIPVVIEFGQFAFVNKDGSVSAWYQCSDIATIDNAPKRILVRHNRELWPLRSKLQLGQLEAMCLDDVLDMELPFEPSPERRAKLLADEVKELSQTFGVDLSKHSTFFDCFNLKFRARAERKMPWARKFDRLFFHGTLAGHSEAYICLDKRPGRKVVLLDFNSMYPFGTLQKNYVNPDELRYESNRSIIESHLVSDDPSGLFHVKINARDDTPAWFCEMHPIRFARKNISVNFRWDGEVLETLLHANEILFFRRFVDVEVIDGIFSEKSVEHPLASTARKLYSFRQLAVSSFTKTLWKKALLSIHGAMNGKHYESRWIKRQDVEDFYLKRFASDPFLSDSMVSISDRHNNAFKLNVYRVDHPRNLYSLISQTLSNSRARLFTFIADIMTSFEHRDVIVCYTNIDSIHLSMPEEVYHDFMQWLQSHAWFGDEIGQLKIESEGTSGLWLDVGRYWIFKDGIPVYFRGPPSETNPFKLKKTYARVSPKTGESSFSRYRTLSGLSAWKTMGHEEHGGKFIRYTRHSLSELIDEDKKNQSDITGLYMLEMGRSLSRKIRLLMQEKKLSRLKSIHYGSTESIGEDVKPDGTIPVCNGGAESV